MRSQGPNLKYTLFSTFPNDLEIKLDGEVRKLAGGRKLFRIIGWELTVNNCRRTL